MAALRRDFLPADARAEMDGCGIDACVAVQARQTINETRWLLELSERHSFIAGVIGWVDLQADDVEDQLRALSGHPKLVGMRHIVQSESDDRFLLRPQFCRGIALLEAFDLTYDILIYPKHLDVATELVSRFERQSFVLDHLAKPDIRSRELREWERGIRSLAACPNVVCKVSGLVTEADWKRWTPEELTPYLDVVFDCFGVERLLVGSDWPVCTLAGSYARVMSVVDSYMAGYAETDREAVLGANAARVWGLRAGELV